MKTVFKNVDEFIAEMLEIKPLLEVMRRVAKQHNDEVKVAEAERVLKMFDNDCALLRESVKRKASPDGSVQFAFTPEAWSMLQKFEKK